MSSEIKSSVYILLCLIFLQKFPSTSGIFSYVLGGSEFSSPGVSDVDKSYETGEKLVK